MTNAIVAAIIVMSILLIIIADIMRKSAERNARALYLNNRANLSYEQIYDSNYRDTDISVQDVICVVGRLSEYLSVDPGKLRPGDYLCDLRFSGTHRFILMEDNDVDVYIEEVLISKCMPMNNDLEIGAISIDDLIYKLKPLNYPPQQTSSGA